MIPGITPVNYFLCYNIILHSRSLVFVSPLLLNSLTRYNFLASDIQMQGEKQWKSEIYLVCQIHDNQYMPLEISGT